MRLYRYSHWDDTQEVFPLNEEDLLEQLAEQMMGNGDIAAALRSLAQRGVRGRNGANLPGLQDLRQRLRQRRQEILERYNLNHVLDKVRERLAEVKRLEQEGVARRREETAKKLQQLQEEGQGQGLQADLLNKLDLLLRKNQAFLQDLPAEPAAAIQQLRGYEFVDPRAKEEFDQLLRWLQQQLLRSTAEQITQQLQSLSPHELRRATDMLRDLNQLLEQRSGGDAAAFQEFMRKHGDLFGPKPPASLEKLVQQLEQQAEQMEALLNSLPLDQRRQLRQALEAALRDPELLAELARLAANLAARQGVTSWRQEYPFRGGDPLDLEQGLDVIGELQRLDEAERQLKRSQQGGSFADVDQDLLRELLGPEALRDFQHLERLPQLLEDAGYIVRVGNHLQLTPRGIRRIGQKALREIFSYIKRQTNGQHGSTQKGTGPEAGEGTKRYEFGDPLALDLSRTIFNALSRGEAGPPLRMRSDDFEVYQTHQQQRSASVLMLDLSLSMAMRGNFLAAKKVALALDNLIRTQFPRDALYIVGFSTYAREIKPERLAYLSWDEFEPYTNIQHGLALAQKLLGQRTDGTKQIIMVSDGEPTAHIEGGHLFLQYPPSPRTLRETLREVKRCTGRGITINTFMLDRNAHLVEFVSQMTRINRGRVFYTSADRLGQYVLVDYLSNRRRLLST